MQKVISKNMELFELATELILKQGKESVLAIIFFGSRVIGKYRENSDLDVLIVTNEQIDFKETRLTFLRQTGIKLDTIVMSENTFEENFTLGSIMMGISIAFCITYDKINAYNKIVRWSDEIEKYNAKLVLPYGEFVVGKMLKKCIREDSRIMSFGSH
ncbi:nucleotidyltransferase domain-containing protein [Sulfolobus tengchongensis]|uniref:Nucleotidyltransferase domain-containing protein n=1 Tax=Sulfolobus tengchongensis TaxID=207809 RepID=A0AAX4L1M8_9CREN